MDVVILLGTLLLCFGIGMPIAYALGLGALAGALWAGIPLEAVMLKIADGVTKGAVLTIPLFVLAAAIMAEGGMVKRLVAFAGVLAGITRLRGGLSAANILAGTFVGGISGSPVADTSAVGSVAIPRMARAGYRRAFATTVTISASVPAALVPPSHHAVIYSLATGGSISIASVFMAGVLPGLLLGAALMLLCIFIAYRDGHPAAEAVPLRAALHAGIDGVLGLMTVVIVVGGLLVGFTAVEAAAMACVWAFLITIFVYRELRWRDLPRLVHSTVRTVALVMMLIAMASSFAYVMMLMQAPARIAAFFLALSDNRYVVLVFINIMLLVLCCLIDTAPLILIAAPILLPVVVALGVDPVHFGAIMLLNLGIGLVTPPLGATLFVGAAVGKVRVAEVMRGIGPFYGVLIAMLTLVTFVPALSLWLPSVALK